MLALSRKKNESIVIQ